MELSILEMRLSKSEHNHKTDPKVGAVLVDTEGRLIETAHRGLEPCVERNHPKLGCSFHTIDARIAKVYIGHKDPDPSVAGGMDRPQSTILLSNVYPAKAIGRIGRIQSRLTEAAKNGWPDWPEKAD